MPPTQPGRKSPIRIICMQRLNYPCCWCSRFLPFTLNTILSINVLFFVSFPQHDHFYTPWWSTPLSSFLNSVALDQPPSRPSADRSVSNHTTRARSYPTIRRFQAAEGQEVRSGRALDFRYVRTSLRCLRIIVPSTPLTNLWIQLAELLTQPTMTRRSLKVSLSISMSKLIITHRLMSEESLTWNDSISVAIRRGEYVVGRVLNSLQKWLTRLTMIIAI